MEELIDPTLVIFSDIAKEHLDMDVLNNAKNSVVDNFRTTKWLFHEILELQHRLNTLEREIYSLKNRVNEDEQSMDRIVDEVNNITHVIDRTMQGIFY